MKTVLLISAILLAGCAKHYQVCVAVHDQFGCMHKTLSRTDAVNVGQAMSALGMDVVVRKDSRKPAAKAQAPPYTACGPEKPCSSICTTCEVEPESDKTKL